MRLGFCFLIYDKIFNESIWKHYFKTIQATGHQYHLYVHAKYPQLFTSQLQELTLLKSIPTKYADISLVRACLTLLSEAYNDNCDYCFLLSGDTLPLTHFKHILPYLDRPIFVLQNKQLINQSKREFNLNNYRYLEKYQCIEFKDFEKQHMFFGINQSSLKQVLAHDVTRLFEKFYAPDEYYFINVIKILKIPYYNGPYILANKQNTIKTKAIVWIINENSIETLRKIPNDYPKFNSGYWFIRKVKFP